MADIFLKLLNLSLSASWIVLAVLVLRLFLRKVPKWVNCLLWSIVGLRLLIPVSVESVLSLLPSREVVPQDILTTQTPAIHSGIPVVNNAINPLVAMYAEPQENLLETILSVAAILWLVGMGVLLIYSVISFLRLRRQVRVSLPLWDNVFLCDDIRSPFILGSLRPKIYLPTGLTEEQTAYVLAHENAHLRRRDHLWKPLGFWVLTVYWFNPLLWVAYILLCRDIEQACDEKVIASMDNSRKKGYSATLVACSMHRKMIMACPVAFGEVGVKTRIKNIVSYKKPTFWILALSIVLCTMTGFCFLTDPLPCKHDYQSQIMTEATCTQRGLMSHTCTQCEHSYSTTIPMLAHNYDSGVITKAPTCAKEGRCLLTCADCGHQKTAAVEKNPHTYDDGAVTKAPTCVEPGSMAYTCTGCGHVKTEVMEMTAHIPSDRIFHDPPNCIEKGTTASVCAYCKTLFITEVQEPNDEHDIRNIMLRAPTCSDPGEGLEVCARCGHTESCTYELLEHNYKSRVLYEGTCSWGGEVEHTCIDCGYSMTTDTPRTDVHKWEHIWGSQYRCDWCREYGYPYGYSSSNYSSNKKSSSNTGPQIPELPSVYWGEPKVNQYGHLTWGS